MCKKFFWGAIIATLISIVSGMNVFAGCNVFFASNEIGLRVAISKVNDGDYIILGNDIYIQNDLELDTSVTLDLNGNAIYIVKEDASIIVGKKVAKKEYMTSDTKILSSSESTVVDGNGKILQIDTKLQTNICRAPKIKCNDDVDYLDDIDVLIKNGKIIHCDGLNGEDGISDTWINFDGRDGKTPSEPIKMLSGTLKLYDMTICGGNGGNGGDGKYQALLHIPFGGGAGGNGGNGANGGNVIKFIREECRLFINCNTYIIPGKAGHCGAKGRANPNWWLYSGIKGKEGEDGIDGRAIS